MAGRAFRFKSSASANANPRPGFPLQSLTQCQPQKSTSTFISIMCVKKMLKKNIQIFFGSSTSPATFEALLQKNTFAKGN
jgi:hypothetical protein